MEGRGGGIIGDFLLQHASSRAYAPKGVNMLFTIVVLLMVLNVQVALVLIISSQHDRRFERYMRVLVPISEEEDKPSNSEV